jgi:hypothetical protein
MTHFLMSLLLFGTSLPSVVMSGGHTEMNPHQPISSRQELPQTKQKKKERE